MTLPFIDTNLLIRLVTSDDPAKEAACRELFRKVQAGELTLRAPDTVIADAVFVLSSRALYNVPRADIRAGLAPLLRLAGFRVQNKRILLRALDLYATTRLDFGDAVIVAAMERAKLTTLYSYDHDFDRIPNIIRQEP